MEVLGQGKVVLFGVPGAFTPTCSDHHLPGFVLRAEELRAKGAEKVVCVSVNDPFVMGAWGQDQNVGDTVVMLADGNGELAEAMGLTMDGSGFGLGPRSQRFAAIIDDGVVTGSPSSPVPASRSARPKRCSPRSDRAGTPRRTNPFSAPAAGRAWNSAHPQPSAHNRGPHTPNWLSPKAHIAPQ